MNRSLSERENRFLSALLFIETLEQCHIKRWICIIKYDGEDGAIVFPQNWPRRTPISFYDAFSHVVEPQLLYVLKSNPSICDPDF